MKLQVFKTGNRGWGLRCLNDVPKGSFICIYAGDLLTEQSANEAGDNFGDEYFAELDYIEVVEGLKEGYEADIPPEDEEEDEYEPGRRRGDPDDSDDDDEFVGGGGGFAAGPRPSNQTRYNTRTRTSSVDAAQQQKQQQRRDDNSDEDDNNERQPISFVPNASESAFDNKTLQTPATKNRSVRRLFGRNEYCYIMDAKKTGNIGRYFNVS